MQFDTIRLSWFGPTELTGFVLLNWQGEPVIVAPQASWDRNLWRIIFDRPRFGTLTFHRGALDVEQRPDGTIDLYETIKPLITNDPRLDLTLHIDQARLRFRAPWATQPVSADRADLTLRIPPAPRALTWQLDLASQSPDAAAKDRVEWQTLGIRGSFDRWGKAPDQNVTLQFSGRDWPLNFAQGGVVVSGRFSGELEAARAAAYWHVKGTTWLGGLDLSGPRLVGDHLRLDRAGGRWAVEQSSSGWSVRELDLSAPVGWLKLDGAFPVAAGATTKLEGELDLAQIARQLPHALRLREGLALEQGSAKLKVEARGDGESQAWQIEAHVTDLAARHGEEVLRMKEPVSISALAKLDKHSLRVEQMGVKTAFLDLTAHGDLENGVALAGTIDLDGAQHSLRDWIDFGGIQLAGNGKLNGSYRRAGPDYQLELAADFRSLALGAVAQKALSADQAHVETQIGGPADDRGLPLGWRTTHVELKSGDLAGMLDVRAREDGARTVAASASVPINLADRAGKAEANLEGLWTGGRLEIASVRAGLRPADDPEQLLFAWSARGRFDRASGTLALDPIDGAPGGDHVISLGREGVRVAGLGKPSALLQADADFEGSVGALVQAFGTWTGRPRPEVGGNWSLHGSVRSADDGLNLASRLDLVDLSWPTADGSKRHTEPPLGLASRATYRPEADRIDVYEIVLTSYYATLEASGQVNELTGRCVADLRGSLQPDWKRVNAALAAAIEPGAQIKGRPRPLTIKGELKGGSTSQIVRGLNVELGIDLEEADVFGMRMGPTPIVARSKDGGLRFDPIRTTLNGGRLSVDPEIVSDDDGSLLLRFAQGATIEGAEINPEVTQRVLAFVVPLLQKTTRARGRVSARIDRAEIPLVSRAGRSTQVEGKIVFNDVEFAPGEIADGILDLIGSERVPTLKLNQPVDLAITDGRVVQRGLAIPVGRLTRVEIEGWVDFARNMELRVSLPITPAMLGNQPGLVSMLGGARISIPIRGTLSRPQFDRAAFADALMASTKKLLGRVATGGANGVFRLFDRLFDPSLRPAQQEPLPREERRARRQERKLERQMERQLPREP
jgi:translocation and assembly module TamB